MTYDSKHQHGIRKKKPCDLYEFVPQQIIKGDSVHCDLNHVKQKKKQKKNKKKKQNCLFPKDRSFIT